MDRRRATTVAGCGAALLVLAAACRQIVGIGDEPPADIIDAGATRPEASVDAGPKCGIGYAGATCETCLQNSCCAQATACSGNSACSAVERCMGACRGDPACRGSCMTSHVIGANPFEDGLSSCLASSCAQACGLTCGGMAEFLDDAAASCQSCLSDKGVCATALDCAKNPDCQALVSCTFSNQQLDRQQACAATHDAGYDAAVATRMGLETSCATECAVGNQWWCLGHVATPPQFNSTTAVTLSVVDLATQQPSAGISVAACSPLLPPCMQVSSNVTDDAGTATVSFPNTANLPATGYLFLSEGGIAPELAFWGFPLSEPSVRLSGYFATQAEWSLLESELAPVDSSRGVVSVIAEDCLGSRSPGMRFSISPSGDGATRLYYFHGSSFVQNGPTDVSGLAIFVNVPVGNVTITAKADAVGGKATSAGAAVTVAGMLTGVVLPPNQ